MSAKGMKIMQSSGKFLDTKLIDLEFYESYIYRKQKWVSFLKVSIPLKEANFELVSYACLGVCIGGFN